MRVNLNLLLDLTPPATEETAKILRQHIVSALMTNQDIRELTKRIRVGVVKPALSLHEARQAGGKLRWEGLSSSKRKLAAQRAAAARWNPNKEK